MPSMLDMFNLFAEKKQRTSFFSNKKKIMTKESFTIEVIPSRNTQWTWSEEGIKV
jgi:hypothetical protein